MDLGDTQGLEGSETENRGLFESASTTKETELADMMGRVGEETDAELIVVGRETMFVGQAETFQMTFGTQQDLVQVHTHVATDATCAHEGVLGSIGRRLFGHGEQLKYLYWSALRYRVSVLFFKMVLASQ